MTKSQPQKDVDKSNRRPERMQSASHMPPAASPHAALPQRRVAGTNMWH